MYSLWFSSSQILAVNYYIKNNYNFEQTMTVITWNTIKIIEVIHILRQKIEKIKEDSQNAIMLSKSIDEIKQFKI